jgi:hypothetical protein
MKKVLLISFFFILTTIAVLAYETVIIKFPSEELWHKVYYKKIGLGSILQFVPKGQTQQNWKRAVIVHAYDEASYPVNVFMANNVAIMAKNNPTVPYRYLKLNDHDCIVGRCTEDYKGIKAQCEIFRATYVHGGIISIHYINKNKDEFIENYKEWYDIVRKAKFLNTYWRNERTLNKSEFFELW